MVLPRGSSSNVVKALSNVEKVKSILKSNPQKKFDCVQHARIANILLSITERKKVVFHSKMRQMDVDELQMMIDNTNYCDGRELYN